jgi:hypothetical protein
MLELLQFKTKTWNRRLTASLISRFSDCEFALACQSLFADLPIVPQPIAFVFGIAMHKFYQRIYASPPQSAFGLAKYGIGFLKKVFEGIHGPESESSAPVEIQWLDYYDRIRLEPKEIEERIEEKKKRYLGGAHITLRAIALERTSPSPFVRNELEFDLKKYGITINDPDDTSRVYPLSGRIDRLPFFPNGDYIIIEAKTGAAQREWKRNKIVRDIQITLYQYGCERIFDRPPKAIFVQPLGVSKNLVQSFGGKALEKIRISIEIRKDPVHFENLAHLASDVSTVIEMIIAPNRFSKEEKDKWTPRSYWGRMADFRRNIDENRFIPRIGETWCGGCSYLGICQKANQQDWEKYRQSVSLEKSKTQEIDAVSSEVKTKEDELFLFEMPRRKNLGKSEREIKKEMLISGEFIEIKRLPALVKKIHQLIPLVNGQPCPCRRLKLIPFFIFDYLRGKKILPEIFKDCPYEGCPHRRPA